MIFSRKKTKNDEADKLLDYIWEKFNMLPFALRWITKDWEEKKAREFLEKRDKVKISMFFRGRWMAHVDLGMQTINKMIEAVAELGKPEGAPKRFGKNFIVIIAPK